MSGFAAAEEIRLRSRVDLLEAKLVRLEAGSWDAQDRVVERLRVTVEAEVLFTLFKAFAVIQLAVVLGLLLARTG